MPTFTGPAHGTAAQAAAWALAAASPVTGFSASSTAHELDRGTAGETTVTKADGSTVEVHLDSSFNALQGPGGPGAPPAAGSGA